jgi:two-component system phosphate regulon response regulator OmpR
MKNFKAHILVVDDDDGIRNLVKQYLSQNDFLVTTAKNSEDAQKKTKIVKFDLIVLDIMMPGKTGLEFTHENKSKIDTPILLLTAKGESSERIEGLEVGADDYLSKPFEPKELILRIKNILNKTKLKVSKTRIYYSLSILPIILPVQFVKIYKKLLGWLKNIN